MFNCSQLFNNSSIFTIDKCLKFCNNLVDYCLCECLEDYKDGKSQLSKQQVFTIGISIVLTAGGVYLFGMKCRQRNTTNIVPILNRNSNTNNNSNSNTNNNAIPDNVIQINYYDLPKYEDIRDDLVVIPFHVDYPPKYEKLLIK